MNGLIAEAKKKGPLGMPMAFWAGIALVGGYLAYRWWTGSSANSANNTTPTTDTTTPTSPDVIVTPNIPGASPAPTPSVVPNTTKEKPPKHHKHTRKSHRDHHTPTDHKQKSQHEHRGTHKTGEHAPVDKKRHSSNEKARRTTRNVPHRGQETGNERRAQRRSVAAAQHHHNEPTHLPGPVKEPEGEKSQTHRAKEPPRKRDHGRGRR